MRTIATVLALALLASCKSTADRFDELAEEACGCREEICAMRAQAAISRLREAEPTAAEKATGAIRYAEICIEQARWASEAASARKSRSQQAPRPAVAPAAAPAPIEPPVVVTARTLERAYDSNEVAADDLYKGKALRVTGVIESIKSGDAGVVIIFRSPGISGAHCHLGLSVPPEIRKLRRGRQARVLGVGAGASFLGPQIDDCKLEAWTE